MRFTLLCLVFYKHFFCFVITLFCPDLYRDFLFLHGQPVPILCYFSMNTGTSEVKQVHISSTYHRLLNYFFPCFFPFAQHQKLLEYSHMSERSCAYSKNFLLFAVSLRPNAGHGLLILEVF